MFLKVAKRKRFVNYLQSFFKKGIDNYCEYGKI